MKNIVLLNCLVVVICSVSLADTDPNLVGWWKMDGPTEGEDVNFVKDYSGNGNDGTMGSSDIWIEGGGINFDGGYFGVSGIQFANTGVNLIADMGLKNQVTVSYMCTWDGPIGSDPRFPTGKSQYLFDGRDIGNNIRMLSAEYRTDYNHLLNHMGGSWLWHWEAFNEFDTRFIFQYEGIDKTWGDMIMITMTVDFTTGDYKLYVDGQLYAFEGGKTGSFVGLATFYIGRDPFTWACMEGNMKDFRIYNRALSQPEVTNLALANLPGGTSLTIKIDPNFLDSERLVPSIGEHQYYIGSQVALSANKLVTNCPDVYEFDHWIGDVENSNSLITKITLSEDKEVTAVYIAKERVCGDLCHPILKGDLNGDCYINFEDFAIYTENWLSCTHPDCD